MSLAINAKTFVANIIAGLSVTYTGPANTFSLKDLFVLKARAPKPTAAFGGNAVTQHKFTRTLALTGQPTAFGDAIVEITVSNPQGSAGADVDALLNDSGSYLSSATAKAVAKTGQINY